MSLDVVAVLWRLLGWDARTRLSESLVYAPQAVREEMLLLAANAALDEIQGRGIRHSPTRADLVALLSSPDAHVRELAVRLAGQRAMR